MKVLVTGSEGQLGKTFQAIYNYNKNIVFAPKSDLDITDGSHVEDYMSQNKFDYCINCAAYTNVEKAEEEPSKAFNINANGTKNLAISCKNNNVTLIHVSTDYVFDGKKRLPYKESDLPNPINTYGKTKLLGEQNIVDNLNTHFIIRSSWLYSNYNDNFLLKILHKVNNNERLKIISTQFGTPTSCNQLAQFICFLIKSKNKSFGIYHFTAKGKATWYDFAVEIAKSSEAYNLENLSAVDNFKSIAKRPEYSVLSLDKIKKFYPKIRDWRIELGETIQIISNDLKQHE